VGLVSVEHPIPLGSFQVVRPLPRLHLDANLDVLRVRFTPARGRVYGPPSAVEAADGSTGRVFTIVPPENRILNPESSWLRYDAAYATFANPEPSDTYDGADQNSSVSWGVVDDTCDGVINVSVVVNAQRFTAEARISVGPPDFAPDRRPFFSLADDLTDRDVEPLTTVELGSDEAVTKEAVADLFARAFETASLANLDALRARALDDNRTGIQPPAIKDLPFTDDKSMTVQDTPYADEKIRALPPGSTPADRLPYTDIVPLAHEALAELDGLLAFFRAMPERARMMLRPAYGAFSELSAIVNNTDAPNPDFRDPRLDRDQAHDMRMPPYMRDELSTALSLTR
jgi:hypothetical protein